MVTSGVFDKMIGCEWMINSQSEQLTGHVGVVHDWQGQEEYWHHDADILLFVLPDRGWSIFNYKEKTLGFVPAIPTATLEQETNECAVFEPTIEEAVAYNASNYKEVILLDSSVKELTQKDLAWTWWALSCIIVALQHGFMLLKNHFVST